MNEVKNRNIASGDSSELNETDNINKVIAYNGVICNTNILTEKTSEINNIIMPDSCVDLPSPALYTRPRTLFDIELERLTSEIRSSSTASIY